MKTGDYQVIKTSGDGRAFGIQKDGEGCWFGGELVIDAGRLVRREGGTCFNTRKEAIHHSAMMFMYYIEDPHARAR
jgi:hypothetical protein